MMYSSGSRPVAPRVSSPSQPSGQVPHDAATVAMPSGPPDTHNSNRGGTLESARLPGRPDTHSALSSPDSRIEVLATPLASASPRRALLRYVLPAAAGLLLVGGFVLLRGRPEPSPAASVEPPVASAPAPGSASFTLVVDSDPAGASVSEGSVRLGSTPFSLTLELAEGASPRVFVVEKDGYQPYVVRQGAAHGQVRVMAVLSPKQDGPAAATTPAPEPAVKASLPQPNKPHAPAPKRPAAPPPARPQSDIRLER
jgi:serine/threonine-protein kinase